MKKKKIITTETIDIYIHTHTCWWNRRDDQLQQQQQRGKKKREREKQKERNEQNEKRNRKKRENEAVKLLSYVAAAFNATTQQSKSSQLPVILHQSGRFFALDNKLPYSLCFDLSFSLIGQMPIHHRYSFQQLRASIAIARRDSQSVAHLVPSSSIYLPETLH